MFKLEYIYYQSPYNCGKYMECVCIRKIFELYLDILSAVQKRHVYFFKSCIKDIWEK